MNNKPYRQTLPRYHAPALLDLMRELGYSFHSVKPPAMFNGEETYFANAEGKVIVAERTKYNDRGVYHLTLKMGRLGDSGYDADGLHKPYPEEFDVERAKEILDRILKDVYATLRTKRLNALIE